MSSLVRMTVGLTAGMDARRARHLHSDVTARERLGFVLLPISLPLSMVWTSSVFTVSETLQATSPEVSLPGCSMGISHPHLCFRVQ